MRPGQREPARVSATTARLADEFRDTPFGGHASGGEVLAPEAAAPPPPQPLQIEPPPWSGRETELALAPPVQSDEPTALDRIKIDGGDYDPEPPRLDPPVVNPPLTRPEIPEPADHPPRRARGGDGTGTPPWEAALLDPGTRQRS